MKTLVSKSMRNSTFLNLNDIKLGRKATNTNTHCSASQATVPVGCHYSGGPQVSKALAMSAMWQLHFNFEHVLGFGTVVKKILIQSEYKTGLADTYIYFSS